MLSAVVEQLLKKNGGPDHWPRTLLGSLLPNIQGAVKNLSVIFDSELNSMQTFLSSRHSNLLVTCIDARAVQRSAARLPTSTRLTSLQV